MVSRALNEQEVRTVQQDFSRSEKQTGLEAWWGLNRRIEDQVIGSLAAQWDS